MNTFITSTGNRLEGPKQVIEVKHVNGHILYDSSTGENNLVLLELMTHIDCNSYQLPICIPERDFAEHVLISELVSTLSGWKMNGNQLNNSLTRLHVSYLHEDECQQAFNRSLITREFCGYSNETVGEPLAGGSFGAVEYKGTWFLTGVLEPRATEASKWNIFIFTKTSRYMMWFRRIME